MIILILCSNFFVDSAEKMSIDSKTQTENPEQLRSRPSSKNMSLHEIILAEKMDFNSKVFQLYFYLSCSPFQVTFSSFIVSPGLHEYLKLIIFSVKVEQTPEIFKIQFFVFVAIVLFKY